MSLVTVAVPIISALAELLRSRSADVAQQTGLSKDVVSQVGDAIDQYLTQDERAMQVVMGEIDKARQHDVETSKMNTIPLIALLQGLVRPLITLTAFIWYVYARAVGVPLGAEDYAIIGGILAFWFGFRPFEKGNSAIGTPATGGR
jgi:hypothetical protein